MSMFKDMLSSDETLFKNPVALDFDYIPKRVPHRDTEQNTIISTIKPLTQKRNGRNLVVAGKPGIGKTLVCNKVIQALDEEDIEGVLPIYINCWKSNTTFKIMSSICEGLGLKFIHNKKTDELFRMVKDSLNKTSALFIFDEIDKMEDFDFLYMILEGVYRKSIIMLTNYKDWIAGLDSRIKSRLTPEMIEFIPYTFSQTHDILKERKDDAFYENIWTDDVFDLIVKSTAKKEDIRYGLNLLKESANLAENESSRKVLKKHVEAAILKSDVINSKETEELDDESQIILDIAGKNPNKKIGDLFKIYEEQGGKRDYKTFQRKIKKLADCKFIDVEKVTGGSKGTTTIIKKPGTKKLTDF